MADRVRWLALAAVAVMPAMALAQRPSEPIAPGLPVKPDGRSGVAIAAPPIPDSGNKMTSTPAEKPVTPAPPPATPLR